MNQLQNQLCKIIETNAFHRTIIAIILFNSAVMIIETSLPLMTQAAVVIITIDQLLVTLMLIEILMKVIAYGRIYFQNYWNIIDFILVLASVIAFTNYNLYISTTLKSLIILRLISAINTHRNMVERLYHLASTLLPNLLLIGILYFMFALIGTNLFRSALPQSFGTFTTTLFTLFQVMTLDWVKAIAMPIIKLHPYAWVYFVSFILLITSLLLNLLIDTFIKTLLQISKGASSD